MDAVFSQNRLQSRAGQQQTLLPKTATSGGAIGVQALRFFATGPCRLAAASTAGSVLLADARTPGAFGPEMGGCTSGEYCVSLETSRDGCLVIGGTSRNRVSQM